MPSKSDPIARELEKLTLRANADHALRAHARETEARAAYKKAFIPLIGFDGPDDPREWQTAYAKLVIDAARAVRTYTGWKSLRGLQRPPSQLKIAHELFRMAYDGMKSASLTAEVRKVMEVLAKRRVLAERFALNDYYEWLWNSLDTIDSPASLAKRRSGGIQDPEPDALRSGYQRVTAMPKSKKVSVEEIIDLYGLGGLEPSRFLKSSKFVQPAGKPKATWRLPCSTERGERKRDKTTKQFRPVRSWTAGDVCRAMEGWAARLRVDLSAARGPF